MISVSRPTTAMYAHAFTFSEFLSLIPFSSQVRMQAIVTAAILKAPTSALAGSLFSLYHAAEDSQMK